MRVLIAFLLACSSVIAADTYIVATITPTNAPTTNGQTITVNGNTRTLTNNITGSPSTTVLTNTTLGGAATNLAEAFRRSRPIVGGFVILTPSNVTLRAENNVALSVTIGGSWASVSYSTNDATNSTGVFVPLENSPAASRTNIASHLVSGLSQYSTQAFATNATALSNFLNLGTAEQVVKNKVFTNSAIQGGSASNVTLVRAVGTITNATILGGTLTNNAIKRSNFTETNAFGPNSVTTFSDSATIRGDEYATTGITWNFIDDIPTTNTVYRHGDWLIQSNIISSTFSDVDDNLTLISNTKLAKTNGTTHSLTMGNTNVVTGDWSVTPLTYTSLVNGDNTDLSYGTNASIYASGATTIAKVHSLVEGRTGQRLRIRMSGAITNIIANESGTEGTAARRITTGTGGDVWSTNSPTWLELEYTTASRWELISIR